MDKQLSFFEPVVDKRRKEKYQVDEAYIDLGYSRVCRESGTAVYNSLCRHANATGKSFTSQETIARQHGIGKKKVVDGIRALEKWNIISVRRTRDPRNGHQLPNVYVLIDSAFWIPIPKKKESSFIVIDTYSSTSELGPSSDVELGEHSNTAITKKIRNTRPKLW